MSNSLQPHELQHTRSPCSSPTPGVHPNSCPSSRWCHPAISSSVVPFSTCPQSLPASGSFPMSQLFAWGGWSIGVSASASVLPMNTQDWSPLGWRAHIGPTQSKTGPLVVRPSGLYFNKPCRWFWCSQKKQKKLWTIELAGKASLKIGGRVNYRKTGRETSLGISPLRTHEISFDLFHITD